MNSDNPYEPPAAAVEITDAPTTDGSSSWLARNCWSAYFILSWPGALLAGLLSLIFTSAETILTSIGSITWFPIWILSYFTAYRFNGGTRTWVPFVVNLVPVSMLMWSSSLSQRRSAPSLLGFYYLVLLSVLLLAGLLAALRSRRRPAATDVPPRPSE